MIRAHNGTGDLRDAVIGGTDVAPNVQVILDLDRLSAGGGISAAQSD